MFNSQSQAPAISVCLPVFNGEKYLAAAIQSVLDQSFENFELLIADDCSSDSSAEIIAHYASTDRRIKSWKNENNMGLFANYNECIRRSRGAYIKPFAQDDVFYPTVLQRMSAVLEEKPTVTLVACAKHWVDDSGEPVEGLDERIIKSLMPLHEDTYIKGDEVVLDSLSRFLNWLGEPSTVMFRKAQAGYGFDVNFKQIGDLEYWYRLLQKGDYFFIGDILCNFRKHLDSTTNKNSRSLAALLDWFVLGSKHRHYIEQMGESEDDFCQRLTRRLIKTVATRFDNPNDPKKIDRSLVFTQLTGFRSALAGFVSEPDCARLEEKEYQVFSVCALKEGAELHKEVQYAQNQIEFQETQLADLKTELEDVRAALQNENEELRTTLSELGNSLSWRITTPLRKIKKLWR